MHPDFDILADENVDVEIISKLRSLRFNVISVLESYSGINDEEVLRIANLHKSVVLTEDKDFGELIYRKKRANYGIILIRLSNLSREERVELVINILKINFEKLKMSFSVISNQGLRIKKL